MGNNVSFQDYAVVPCGMVNLELYYLNGSGFLNARKILYAERGQHEILEKLKIS